MSRSLRRILPPVTLLVAGACALIYGASARTVPVVAEVMVEKEVIVLDPPPRDWPGSRGGPGGRGPILPPPPPRPRRVKQQVAEEQVQVTPEPKVTRDVTVGGITRLQDGRIKLTYRPGEDGPALCPT
ncbi:MAG: hypothetical protein HY718_20015 [Planctomycetes bacterium]|nr:hypothetical protein [Planctomycetota bacterium]